jgi:hypothetical protein
MPWSVDDGVASAVTDHGTFACLDAWLRCLDDSKFEPDCYAGVSLCLGISMAQCRLGCVVHV